MIKTVIDLLWGALGMLFCCDLWTKDINIVWWAYIILLIILIVLSIAAYIYSVITDYKNMYNQGTELTKFISNKLKKTKKND